MSLLYAELSAHSPASTVQAIIMLAKGLCWFSRLGTCIHSCLSFHVRCFKSALTTAMHQPRDIRILGIQKHGV